MKATDEVIASEQTSTSRDGENNGSPLKESSLEVAAARSHSRVAHAVQTSRFKKKLSIALVVIAAAALCFLIWYFVLRTPVVASNVVFVSGRIEGDESVIATKIAGRIIEIHVREGDNVSAGQVIAVVDDARVSAREQQAQSLLRQSEARLPRALQQINVLREQLRQSELGEQQAQLDTQGRVSQAQAQVAAAEADLAQAEANYEQARDDAERFARLARTGDVPERDSRQANSALKAQAAVVAALRNRIEEARAVVTLTRSSIYNPRIRSSATSLIKQQMLQAQADVEAAQAEIEQARAALEEVRIVRRDLNIVAPFEGTISTRFIEPGEVVAAGAPVVTVINLAEVYLRGFVPEGEIGRIRVGQRARVFLDSDVRAPLDAVVTRIDPEASFTPENTYFREDRVKQVVGIKLQLRDAGGFAKPGMPADGEVITDADVRVNAP